MDTATYELSNVVPAHAMGLRFLSLQTAIGEFLPLAVVWWTHKDEPTVQRGSRIDLQKRVFLDDFGPIGKDAVADAAGVIVSYLYERLTKQHVMVVPVARLQPAGAPLPFPPPPYLPAVSGKLK